MLKWKGVVFYDDVENALLVPMPICADRIQRNLAGMHRDYIEWTSLPLARWTPAIEWLPLCGNHGPAFFSPWDTGTPQSFKSAAGYARTQFTLDTVETTTPYAVTDGGARQGLKTVQTAWGFIRTNFGEYSTKKSPEQCRSNKPSLSWVYSFRNGASQRVLTPYPLPRTISSLLLQRRHCADFSIIFRTLIATVSQMRRNQHS